MKLHQIKEILNADILTGEEFLDREVKAAFGSDLMSDVLAYVNDSVVLLTGLTNHQVIRTAEMIDLFAIVFVRGKTPSDEILELAAKNNITLMRTNNIMYMACGKLYENGLKGVGIEVHKDESAK